ARHDRAARDREEARGRRCAHHQHTWPIAAFQGRRCVPFSDRAPGTSLPADGTNACRHTIDECWCSAIKRPGPAAFHCAIAITFRWATDRRDRHCIAAATVTRSTYAIRL